MKCSCRKYHVAKASAQPWSAIADLGWAGPNGGLDLLQVAEVWAQGFTGAMWTPPTAGTLARVSSTGICHRVPALASRAKAALWQAGIIAGARLDGAIAA
jgi:hypothetical protein